jgi:hypothetical protein
MNETIDLSANMVRSRTDLHRIAGALGFLCVLLLALAGRMPPESPEADETLDLDTLDEPTEIRSVILCVVQDYLRPAIEDLLAVAGPPPEGLQRGWNDQTEHL